MLSYLPENVRVTPNLQDPSLINLRLVTSCWNLKIEEEVTTTTYGGNGISSLRSIDIYNEYSFLWISFLFPRHLQWCSEQPASHDNQFSWKCEAWSVSGIQGANCCHLCSVHSLSEDLGKFSSLSKHEQHRQNFCTLVKKVNHRSLIIFFNRYVVIKVLLRLILYHKSWRGLIVWITNHKLFLISFKLIGLKQHDK